MLFQEYYEAALRLGWFDPCFYLDALHAQGLSVDAGLSLFEHFATVGWKHGVSPSSRFSVARYLAEYQEVADRQVDPLYHYMVRGQREHRRAFPLCESSDDVRFVGLYRFKPPGQSGPAADPINVAPHDGAALQPSISSPSHADIETAGRQLALARSHGISAFCIQYDGCHDGCRGRDVLDQIDVESSFCLLLDHGNWTRRGDGPDGDTNLDHDGSLADYSLICDLLEKLSDPRYLRVCGKPLLVVYRPERLKDAPLTFELWREVARRRGLGGLYVAGLPSRIEPHHDWGLDGLIDAPLDPAADGFEEPFAHYGHDVEPYRQRSAAVPVFPGFMPDQGLAPSRAGTHRPSEANTPELFRSWLTSAAERTRDLVGQDLPRLAFIDAGNGWADGSQEFLKSGDATLEGGQEGLSKLRHFAQAMIVASRLPVLFVCDDTAEGEQRLVRRLIESLGQSGTTDGFLVVDSDGPASDFLGCASSFSLCELKQLGWSREQAVDCLAGLLRARGDLVVVSATFATAGLLAPFAARGHRVVSMVNELPASTDLAAYGSAFGEIGRCAQRIIVGSDVARKRISTGCGIPADDIRVIQPGILKLNSGPASRSLGDLGLPDARRVIVAFGTVQQSTGVDLFIQVARHLTHGDNPSEYLFIWIASGQSNDDALTWAQYDAQMLGLAERVKFIAQADEMEALIQLADVLLVTSRQDAEPLALLEAVSAGAPVVCFDTAGEIAELVSKGLGTVVAYLDCLAMAEAARVYLSQSFETPSARLDHAAELARTHSWPRYVEEIGDCLLGLGNEGKRIRLTGRTLGRQQIADDLCVVIPSYNHKRYILQALDSILAQSLRPKEIRIIDDGSDDGSAELVQSLASDELGIFVQARENRGAHTTINEAIAGTECPIVAIMNSDDRWHPVRIEELIGELRRPGGADVVFSRLRFIDLQPAFDHKVRWYEDGVADYNNGVPLWLSLMFCNFFFTTSNLIARRDKLFEVGALGPFRFCHDLDYILKAIFAGHKVQFVDQTLCEYRFHGSNTIDVDMQALLFEEAWIIAKYLKRNYQRISQSEMTLAAQRCLNKGLAAKVLGIMQALAHNQIEYDYKTTYGGPAYQLIAAHISDYASRKIAGPEDVVRGIEALMPETPA